MRLAVIGLAWMGLVTAGVDEMGITMDTVLDIPVFDSSGRAIDPRDGRWKSIRPQEVDKAELDIWRYISESLVFLVASHVHVEPHGLQIETGVWVPENGPNSPKRFCLGPGSGEKIPVKLRYNRRSIFQEMEIVRREVAGIRDVLYFRKHGSAADEYHSIGDLYDMLGLAFVRNYSMTHVAGLTTIRDIKGFLRILLGTVFRATFYRRNRCLWENVFRMFLRVDERNKTGPLEHREHCDCFHFITEIERAVLRADGNRPPDPTCFPIVLRCFCPVTFLLLRVTGCRSIYVASSELCLRDPSDATQCRRLISEAGIESLAVYSLKETEALDVINPTRETWPCLTHLKLGWFLTAEEASSMVGCLPSALKALEITLFLGRDSQAEEALFRDCRLQRLTTSLDMWVDPAGRRRLSEEAIRTIWTRMGSLKRLATKHELWMECPLVLPKPIFAPVLTRLEILSIGEKMSNFAIHLGGLPTVKQLRVSFSSIGSEHVDAFLKRLLGADEPTPLAKSIEEVEVTLFLCSSFSGAPFLRCRSLKKFKLEVQGVGYGRRSEETICALAETIKTIGREVVPLAIGLSSIEEKDLVLLLDRIAAGVDVERVISKITALPFYIYGMQLGDELKGVLEKYKSVREAWMDGVGFK